MLGFSLVLLSQVEPLGVDSSNMRLIWSLPLGSATAVATHGDTVIVALGYQLVFLELGDSLRDVKSLGHTEAPGLITFMRDLGDGRVAIVVEDTALYLLDLSTLQFSSSYYKADLIYDLVYDGSYLYIADGNVDIVNPSDMSLVGQYTPPVGVAKGLDFVYDTVLAVACSTGGLRLVLVFDPSYPFEIGVNTSAYIGKVRTTRIGDSVYAYGARDHNYVGYDIYIYNVTEVTSPTYITYSRGNTYSSPLKDMILDSAQRFIAVISGSYGVQCWYIKDNGRLEYWSRHDPGSYETMAYMSARGVLWLTDGNGQLWAWRSPLPYYRMRYNSSGMVKDVEAYGQYYICANGNSGFFALRFNYEWNWSLVGSFDTEGSSNGVALDYPHAYIADGNGGVYYYNFTLNDTLKHIVLGTSVANQLALAKLNTVLLVAALPRELYILDVTDPQNMDTIAHYTATTGAAVDVAAEGDYAYLALGSAGVEIIDISDPSSPSMVYRFNAPGNVNAVTVKDEILYAVCGTGFDGLVIYDISNPTNPVELARLPMNSPVQNVKGPFHFFGSERKFVALTSGSMLYIADVTDPTAPFLAIRTRPSSYQVNAAVVPPFYERYLLVANAENGLLLYQWGSWIDTLNNYNVSYKGNAVGVSAVENLTGVVYLDSLSNTAKFYDVSDPASPVYISNFGQYPRQALEMGDHYIVYNYNNRYIQLYDFSDPTSPQNIYQIDLGSGKLGQMAVAYDSTLLVVYQNQYLRSYVLHNDTLYYRSQLDIGSPIRGLYFDGVYLWLTTDATLQAVDVIDPSNMSVVGLYSGFSAARDIAVFDTLAFVVDSFASGDTVRVLDVTPLYWMEQVATWSLDTTGSKFFLTPHSEDSAVLYLLNGRRVTAFLVNPPDSLPFDDTLGYYEFAIAPRAYDVYASRYLYFAMGEGGMLALEAEIPFLGQREKDFVDFLTLAPNPSRSATLTLSLSREAQVRVSLYDISGRRVARLVDGKLEAGLHRFAMPGDLPAGVYAVEVRVDGRRVSKVWVKR